jgi:lipopolysaccharide/colanic/teichoic acid biosynthesis glycosyltransferase
MTGSLPQHQRGAHRALCSSKRALDLILTLGGLLLLWPAFLLLGLLIAFTSSGPVFYRQARAGIYGETFHIWKFRSMYLNADARRDELLDHNESDGALFKIKHDPRVTPVGRFLRRSSLDELPQLFNVVSGDMSLVGPRPLPIVDSLYEGEARRRLSVRPGITGLWQVSGRSSVTWDESVRLDLEYIDNWSLAMDLAILAKTPRAVVLGDGAY